MSPVEIATAVVSVLMVASRFVQAAKPLWDRLPRAVAVVLPAAVALVPQIIDLLSQSKTAIDLTTNLIAAAGLVAVGLFPSKAK